MRVWLDPGKVAQRGMTATDVVEAIRKQNVQVAAGVIGSFPRRPISPCNWRQCSGRLRTESEFGSIVLKSSATAGSPTFGSGTGRTGARIWVLFPDR